MKDTAKYLIEKGIHPSLQRIHIMNYLLNHRTHPTVDDIYMALSETIPTLSKTTIYNTLQLFNEKGAVTALNIDEKTTHFDGDITDHAHFQCLGCGKIFDVPIENNISTPDMLKNFSITNRQINYKGYCPECRKKENNQKL